MFALPVAPCPRGWFIICRAIVDASSAFAMTGVLLVKAQESLHGLLVKKSDRTLTATFACSLAGESLARKTSSHVVGHALVSQATPFAES